MSREFVWVCLLIVVVVGLLVFLVMYNPTPDLSVIGG